MPGQVFKDLHENLQIVLRPLWLHLGANPACFRMLLHHLQNQNIGIFWGDHLDQSLNSDVIELHIPVKCQDESIVSRLVQVIRAGGREDIRALWSNRGTL